MSMCVCVSVCVCESMYVYECVCARVCECVCVCGLGLIRSTPGRLHCLPIKNGRRRGAVCLRCLRVDVFVSQGRHGRICLPFGVHALWCCLRKWADTVLLA